MANWAKLQEDTIGKQVVKRAQHGIHFDNGDGQVLAHFSGKPCHYLDGGIYKPIVTKLLLGADGFYGCPHSPVKVHRDGHVKVDGIDYAQYTELPSAQTGLVDGDKIVRPFSFGEQRLWITETGFKSEILLNRIPTLTEARKLVPVEAGILPKEYAKSLTTAADANGKVHTFTTLTAFRTWLASAAFPVVIDPDFAAGTNDGYISGINGSGNYAEARSTGGDDYSFVGVGMLVGQRLINVDDIYVIRSFVLFDTSSIDDAATITQANLKLVITLDNSTTDFDVQIVKQDWSSGTNDQKFDACLSGTADDNIWRNTSGISHNTQYASGNLSTAWISKTGTTYYSLRSSRDVDATEPTGDEFVTFATANHATESYRPILSVTYTEAGSLLRVNMNAQMQNLSGGFHG